VLSGLLVVIGIYLNVYSKNKASWDNWLSHWWFQVRGWLGLGPKYQIYNLGSSVV